MFIEISQLKILYESGAVERLEAIAEDVNGKRMWKISIHLINRENKAIVINQKRKIRYWMQLNTIIAFIEEICPAFNQLTVTYG